MRYAILAAVFLGLGESGASAQSFDCSKASLATEQAICASAELGRLDEQMALLYFGLPVDVREAMRKSQRDWLRRRNRCGFDDVCIADAYRSRIQVLSQY